MCQRHVATDCCNPHIQFSKTSTHASCGYTGSYVSALPDAMSASRQTSRFGGSGRPRRAYYSHSEVHATKPLTSRHRDCRAPESDRNLDQACPHDTPRDGSAASLRQRRLPSSGSPKGKGRSMASPPSPKPHTTHPGNYVAARLEHGKDWPTMASSRALPADFCSTTRPAGTPASSGPPRVSAWSEPLPKERPCVVAQSRCRSLPAAPNPRLRHPLSSHRQSRGREYAPRELTPRPRPALRHPPRRAHLTRRPSAFPQRP